MTSKISWSLKRLKRMPFGEIPYRLNQALLKKLDKYFPPHIPSSLKETTDSNWRKCNDDLTWLRDLPDLLPSGRESLINDAENILTHNFEIFGIKSNFGNPINFHLDPKTGRSWPLKFWGNIEYRDGQKLGGIKFVWELNRLHHWPRLAIAYSLTENKKYLSEIFDELEHWLKTNPYPEGINWISGIELGIRIVNLFYSLKFIGGKQLKPEQKSNILHFVSLHAHHLYRYPSKYSSCANHTLAEALGLYIAGQCFPYLKGANKWKTYGKRILEREVLRQVYPDGSSFEHSIYYLQFVADHFLIYYLICKEYEEIISQAIAERSKAVCNFIASIVDAKGNIPSIGDDDDGFIVKLWLGKHNNFLSLLNTGAILFNKPEWIHPEAPFDSKTLFLLGDSARAKWKKLRAQKSWRRKPTYFDNAGLAVIPHAKSGKEILFVGNSGLLGLKPLGGHGHADALSFWLSVNGQPFFVDPGTYLYYSGGKWRRFFRSTTAHNTIQVDDHDQAEQISDFMFGDFYHIHNLKWSEHDMRVFWGAEHDGYCRLPDPVAHRREVTYSKQDYSFMIVDLLRCKNSHNISLIFHLHPDIKVKPEGDNSFLLTSGLTKLILQVDTHLKEYVYFGSKNPLLGWYSACFNHLEKTNSLIFKTTIYGNSIFKSQVKIL